MCNTLKLGDFATVIATSDKKINFSVWSRHEEKDSGSINIGRFCIICPGVRISSSSVIEISDNCMLASNVYVTDSDWHGVYDRISFGQSAPVKLKDNVWVGDSSIICKGVTIGCNSIIGAGAGVTKSVPPNSTVGGNPAKIVKMLDPKREFVKRSNYLMIQPSLVMISSSGTFLL